MRMRLFLVYDCKIRLSLSSNLLFCKKNADKNIVSECMSMFADDVFSAQGGHHVALLESMIPLPVTGALSSTASVLEYVRN